MPRSSQRLPRPLDILPFHQHIIRIKRRNRKDRNPRLCQRTKTRRQHPSHRKRKGSFQFQRRPSALNQDAIAAARNHIFPAHDRNLIAGPDRAEKLPRQRPQWDRRASSKPANGQPLSKNAIFQFSEQCGAMKSCNQKGRLLQAQPAAGKLNFDGVLGRARGSLVPRGR
jgi:hypothetical protein